MQDPGYQEDFEDADLHAGVVLESKACERAIEGWEEPVFQQGEFVGVKRKYSIAMHQFLLRGRYPEKYNLSPIPVALQQQTVEEDARQGSRFLGIPEEVMREDIELLKRA